MSDFMEPPPREGASGQPSPQVAPPAAPAPAPAAPVAPAWPEPKRSSALKKLLVVLCVLVVVGVVVVVGVALVVEELASLSGGGIQTSVLRAGKRGQVIALYEINGPLGAQQAEEALAYSKAVRHDSNVKAFLLRVTSPGGGISACDRMHKTFSDLVKETGKPMVVSMGGVAASGGYYISVPANAILAEPTTITGSIGVIGQIMVMTETLNKIGLEVRLLPSTKARAWKAAPNPFEKPAKYQNDEVQQIIDQMHQRFEDVVAAGRKGKLNITPTETNTYKRADGTDLVVEETEPFNGRVFLAEKAKQLGLIDKIGFLDDAIDEAAKLAGLSKPKVVLYRRQPSFREELGLFGAGGIRISPDVLDEVQTPKILMMWKVGQ